MIFSLSSAISCFIEMPCKSDEINLFLKIVLYLLVAAKNYHLKINFLRIHGSYQPGLAKSIFFHTLPIRILVLSSFGYAGW
jgi:hypothetical protein